MLLPSALSCDQGVAQPKPHRATRPKLPSFERYDPRQRSQSPVVGLIASCRALHTMLGERFSATPSPSVDVTLRTRPMNSPFTEPTSPPISPLAPRGANKRTREEFEDEHVADASTESSSRHRYVFATPKRRCKAPVELPPGLRASDFEALSHPSVTPGVTPKSKLHQQDVGMPTVEPLPPSGEITPGSANTWTESDDKLLVATVLAKLNLSARDWNDCALRLGKDKDSIGRRWQMLLGGGNIGLRRGSGRMSRVDLDIRSW